MAFFPIFERKGKRIPMSNKWQLTQDLNKGVIENFSITTLEHLAHQGVESNTAGLFQQRQRDRILSDFTCFPWLIVEHKKAGPRAVECHCQAANAGAAAIMMLETLSAILPRAKGHKTGEHIPPVVTMTTVGRVVKVWIMSACRPSDNDGAEYVSGPLFCSLTH